MNTTDLAVSTMDPAGYSIGSFDPIEMPASLLGQDGKHKMMLRRNANTRPPQRTTLKANAGFDVFSYADIAGPSSGALQRTLEILRVDRTVSSSPEILYFSNSSSGGSESGASTCARWSLGRPVSSR